MKTGLLFATLALGLGLVTVISAPAGETEYAVIVNAETPVESGSIRDIFLGEKKFEGSVKLIPIHLADEKAKDAFLAAFVKMSAKDYKTYIVKKVFQDGMTAPMTKSSSKEVVDLVAKEKGAVGYVPKADATGSAIKIIAPFKD